MLTREQGEVRREAEDRMTVRSMNSDLDIPMIWIVMDLDSYEFGK